jgi:Tfp pilus assembly protein PilV
MKKHSHRASFTLIEVVIATTILASMMGLLTTCILALRSSIQAGSDHVEALSIATDEAWNVFSIRKYSDLEAQYPAPTTVSKRVPTNSSLYAAGGTITTGVTGQTAAQDWSDILVTVYWTQRVFGTTMSVCESNTIRRYDTTR